MRNFDITVEGRSGGGERSVEVTTLRDAVSDAPSIEGGARHAADKAAKRLAEGLPVPGDLEATVALEFRTRRVVRGSVIEISPDGEVVRTFPPGSGKPPETSNIIDTVLRDLNRGTVTNANLIKRINIVHRDGSLITTLENNGGRWVRNP